MSLSSGVAVPPSTLTPPRVLCRLALSSLNKLSEAVFYYRKALELDPENETYKSNLKVTEQKMKEAPSPVSGRLAGWLAGWRRP